MDRGVYYVEDGVYKKRGLPSNCTLVKLEKEDEQNRQFNNMYVRSVQYEDLYRALECLQRINYEGDEIINEALFNNALVFFVKCFTNGDDARPHINPEKVFPKNSGEYDRPMEVYKAFKTIRDSFVAHDQEDFKKARVGLVIDSKRKTVNEVVAPFARTHFNYPINAQMLAQVINIALNYVEADIDKNIDRILEHYRSKDFSEIEKFPCIDYESPDSVWLQNDVKKK